MLLYLIIGLSIIFIIILFTTRPSEVIGHWHHYYAKQAYSAQEIFAAIESKIQEHQIPDVKFSRIKAFEFGPLSAEREYLSVQGKHHIFHIGAAPYGTDFFVSVWLRGKEDDLLRQEFYRMFPKLKVRSYYSVDTENMFTGGIHRAVTEALDDMSSQQGIRGLTELERQWVPNPKLTFKVK